MCNDIRLELKIEFLKHKKLLDECNTKNAMIAEKIRHKLRVEQIRNRYCEIER